LGKVAVELDRKEEKRREEDSSISPVRAMINDDEQHADAASDSSRCG